MSVKQKLIECEKSMNEPVDSIEHLLDTKINSSLELIIAYNSDHKMHLPLTPTLSSNGIASSKESSIDSKSGDKDENNNFSSSFSSKPSGFYNFESFVLR